MKKILTVAVLSALTMGAGVASAADYGDTATVISATPIYERVATPRRDCYTEQVTAYEQRRVPARAEYVSEPRYVERQNSGAGAVLGAIVGGVIGHQFGNSSGGRDRGTAAGAIIGGLVGNDIERNSGGYDRYSSYDSGYRRSAYEVERVPVTRDVQRCNIVNDYRDEIRGYDVRYSYNGREYTTRTSYDPGRTIQVNVDVRPVHRSPAPSYSRY